MKNLLIGNGIDIQFGGKEYLNSSILERAIKKIDNNDFNNEVYTKEVGQWLKVLYGEVKEIINGKYDKFAVATYEEKTLKDFKSRYKHNKKLRFTNIGIEDYMFIHELFCRKAKINNPDRFDFRELLKRLLLDSIYNNGKINYIYNNFPVNLKEFFLSYDNIFTTNYDKNISNFCGKEVYYLHGAFHILSNTYDKNSFRNKLSDVAEQESLVVKGYEYLFSTALMSFSGNLKEYSMNMNSNTNNVINKFVEGMENNKILAKEIEAWKDSDNQIVKNMYEAIMLKKNNKELSFNEQYPIDKFKCLEKELDIVGLSPNNDTHIFEIINDNLKIEKVLFYYFDKSDILTIRKILSNKEVEVISVKELWNQYQ